MFSINNPIAWSYHNHTRRWMHNLHDVPENSTTIPPYKEYIHSKNYQLPEVSLPNMGLNDVLDQRFSCRNFAEYELSLEEVALIAKGGYGILDQSYLQDIEFHKRPVPSGGGLYPLELYIIANQIETMPKGIYHYGIKPTVLEEVNLVDLSESFIGNLFLGQPYVAKASAILVITAVMERSLWKYNDRGYRYMLLEAGHLAQNINLIATASGLSSLNLGGFFDDTLASMLALDVEEEIALYAVAIGKPVNDDQEFCRIPSP